MGCLAPAATGRSVCSLPTDLSRPDRRSLNKHPVGPQWSESAERGNRGDGGRRVFRRPQRIRSARVPKNIHDPSFDERAEHRGFAPYVLAWSPGPVQRLRIEPVGATGRRGAYPYHYPFRRGGLPPSTDGRPSLRTRMDGVIGSRGGSGLLRGEHGAHQLQSHGEHRAFPGVPVRAESQTS